MTEKLKYKVSDKVWVQGEIIEADYEDQDSTYKLSIGEDDYNSKRWFPNSWFKDNKIQSNQQLVTKTLPKVTQAVMDWFEKHKRSHWNVRDYFVHTPEEIDNWLSVNLQNEHAFVTLIVYGPEAVEVEKEKRYKVTLKSNGQILVKVRLAGDKASYDFMYSDVTEPYYTK